MAQACEQALAEAGYAMLVVSSDYQPEREVTALELLRSRGVDGIVLHVSDESHAGLARALARIDIPLVLLDLTLRVPADRVLSAHADAMNAAVQHLAGLGHRRIALVQHEQRVRPGLERQRAFVDAAAALRLRDARVLRLPRSPGQDPVLPDDLFKGPQAPTALLADGTRLLPRGAARLASLRAAGAAGPFGDRHRHRRSGQPDHARNHHHRA